MLPPLDARQRRTEEAGGPRQRRPAEVGTPVTGRSEFDTEGGKPGCLHTPALAPEQRIPSRLPVLLVRSELSVRSSPEPPGAVKLRPLLRLLGGTLRVSRATSE